MFKTFFAKLGPKALTLATVLLALVAARQLWIYYQVEPWTPDGRVRANVVAIAPDVSGLVTEIPVRHDEFVKKGQLLFQIDRERYALALRQAEDNLAAQRVRLEELRRENARNLALGELVAKEQREQSATRVQEAEAALAQAVTARNLAALNLERTRVLAPSDGVLSDLNLQVGDYALAGKSVMALIRDGSVWVEGYFEETKLAHIRIGQPARIKLMGDDRVLKGRVYSIVAGIEDRDRAVGASLLPNVNPTFSWVRLAQRVPVRVALDNPRDPALVVGRTATVTVLDGPARAKGAQ